MPCNMQKFGRKVRKSLGFDRLSKDFRLVQEQQLLKNKIQEARDSDRRISLEEATKDVQPVKNSSTNLQICLKGHYSKVHALDWTSDSDKVITASQDGYIILWEASSGRKLERINSDSCWTMTCAISDNGHYISSGGLDGHCSIFKKNADHGHFQLMQQLEGHEAYMTCCRFLTNHQLLTSSGDKTAILWNIGDPEPIKVFEGHEGVVTAIDVSPDRHCFVSVGCDATAKIWDLRDATCVHTLYGHSKGINSVTFLPGSHSFITGADDGSCKLFDIRSNHAIATYSDNEPDVGVTAIASSRSGRLLYVSTEAGDVDVWDVLKVQKVAVLPTEGSRVSCLGVTPDGSAVAAGTWDNIVRIWS